MTTPSSTLTPPGPRPLLYEVGPRDGLQNEAVVLSTDDKIAFIQRLIDAGLKTIEVTAFVHPQRVPAMGDAAAVVERLPRLPDVRYSALVPNAMGLRRALDAGIREVAVIAAASETFSRRNINQSIDESLHTYANVVRAAHAAGVPVRGYVSTAFGCPFEGRVPLERVVDLTRRLLDLGVFEVAVSDTIGVAHPAQVTAMVAALAANAGLDRIALHLHDTRGMAVANVLTAYQLGVRTFDAAAGGLGGCPYAPGASGNVATEELVFLFHGLGIETRVDLDKLANAAISLEPLIGHQVTSKFTRAWRTTNR